MDVDDKFQEYCLQIAHMYVNLFPWYYMPPNIHKNFCHGHSSEECLF